MSSLKFSKEDMTVTESILPSYFSGLRHMLKPRGTDDKPLWRLQIDSSILMTAHSLQNVIIASIGENLLFATFRTKIRREGHGDQAEGDEKRIL